jgi:hypothetical protein
VAAAEQADEPDASVHLARVIGKPFGYRIEKTMDAKLITILTDGLQQYSSDAELRDLCEAFEVDPEIDPISERPVYHRLSIKLITKIEHGNNRELLLAITSSLVNRANDFFAHSDWERRTYHQGMLGRLQSLEQALDEPGLPDEMSVSENRAFSAKSQMREFLAAAATPVTIVDAYVGIGTLDCMRDITHSMRLLTGQRPRSIENGFDRALREFVNEQHTIEVRQHSNLHDRYVSFNDRCWLVGSSLKDAGKKTFNLIEFVDGKAVITSEIEAKWRDAQPYTF